MKKNTVNFILSAIVASLFCSQVFLLTGCANFLNEKKGFVDSDGNATWTSSSSSSSSSSVVNLDYVFNVKLKSETNAWNIIVPSKPIAYISYYLFKGVVSSGAIDYDASTTYKSQNYYVTTSSYDSWSDASYIATSYNKIPYSSYLYIDPSSQTSYGYLFADKDWKAGSIYNASNILTIYTSSTSKSSSTYSWAINFSKTPDALYLLESSFYDFIYKLPAFAQAKGYSYEEFNATATSVTGSVTTYKALYAKYGNYYIMVCTF